MNSENVKVIAQSMWKPASGGMAKCRVVLWQMEERPEFLPARARYATHMEVELADDQSPYFHAGNYDMRLREALDDFEARCKREGIEPVAVIPVS